MCCLEAIVTENIHFPQQYLESMQVIVACCLIYRVWPMNQDSCLISNFCCSIIIMQLATLCFYDAIDSSNLPEISDIHRCCYYSTNEWFEEAVNVLTLIEQYLQSCLFLEWKQICYLKSQRAMYLFFRCQFIRFYSWFSVSGGQYLFLRGF